MYLALIEQVLAKKKQVIVLIPEISLTYQTVETFFMNGLESGLLSLIRECQREKSPMPVSG